MPKLDGKHYSYDAKGKAEYKRDKKKKGSRKKKRSTLRGSMMGGGY